MENATSLIESTTEIINTTIASVIQGSTHMHDHHSHHHHMAHGTTDQKTSHGHQMLMWFHSGYEEVILVDSWRTKSYYDLFISCIIIFMMGALYEGFKWFRLYIQTYSVKNSAISLRISKEYMTTGLIKSTDNGNVYCKCVEKKVEQDSDKGIRSQIGNLIKSIARLRVFHASLYGMQLILAYWLMLIVMTYNIWLTAAVILGAVCGNWIFAAVNCYLQNPLSQEDFICDACH
uniref:Copper transport protein n=1 Tax=Acrobeloides nanus TaxID=290746 RepID=A0A914CHC6_9BILA